MNRGEKTNGVFWKSLTITILLAFLVLTQSVCGKNKIITTFDNNDTTGIHNLYDTAYLKKLPFDTALSLLKKAIAFSKKITKTIYSASFIWQEGSFSLTEDILKMPL